MILPDHAIRALKAITPFNEEQLQPASYDVRLGDDFVVDDVPLFTPELTLAPGQFVLGCTQEHVSVPPACVARIEGKSSIGRKGILIHVTAGFIDPGFRGRVTLEIVNLSNKPFVLIEGMSIAQVTFIGMAAPPENVYNGRYQDAETVEAAK